MLSSILVHNANNTRNKNKKKISIALNIPKQEAKLPVGKYSK